MSGLKIQLIQPNPTSNSFLAPGTSTIPIHPISLFTYGPIPTIITFPKEIELDRLVSAIQSVAARWPTVAGRFEKVPGTGKDGQFDFQLGLTNSSIPLSTQTISTDAAFPTCSVIQPRLDPYLPSLDKTAIIPNADVPLLAFRLTTLIPPANPRFLRHLSSIYANETLPAEHPTFGPHLDLPHYPPDLEDELLRKLDIFQIRPFEMDEMFAAYKRDQEASEPVVITLTRAELGALKEEFQAVSKVRLSEQDVLTAWWVGLLEEVGEKVDRIVYAVNYRGLIRDHPSFPANLPSLCGNVAQMYAMARSPAIPEQSRLERLVFLAQTIRAGLLELRTDVELTLAWLSVCAFRLEQAALDQQFVLSLPAAGDVVVNSNLRYDWNIPFGFPTDQTRYHTIWSARRVLRVFQANPRGGQAETDVELCFNLVRGGGRREVVQRLMEEDRRRWRGA